MPVTYSHEIRKVQSKVLTHMYLCTLCAHQNEYSLSPMQIQHLLNEVVYFCLFQELFNGLVTAYENGGRAVRIQTTLGYTKDQVETIQRLKNSNNDYERLGIRPGASK